MLDYQRPPTEAASALLPDILRCECDYDGDHGDQCDHLQPEVIGKTTLVSGLDFHG